MRLNQLLGWSLPLVLSAVGVAVPTTQLTELRVQAQGNGSTVSIQANGAFTHTEYRPAEGLLLVDLPGVAPGRFANQSSTVNAGGVESYHVQTFRGASGSDTTRLEISLATHSVVTVKQQTNTSLLVEVSGGATAGTVPAAEKSATLPTVRSDESTTAVTAAVVPAAIETQPAEAHSTGRPAVVKGVSVTRSARGMDVEIKLDRSLTPRVLKLTNPDRIVLDLPGAIPAAQLRNVSVNSNLVKAVRMARNQITPPVTRIVVDLASPSSYEIVPSGANLALRLTPAQAVAVPAAQTHAAEIKSVEVKSVDVKSGSETRSSTTPAASNVSNASLSASATVPALPLPASAVTPVVSPASKPQEMNSPGLNLIQAASPATVETSTPSPSRGDLAAQHFAQSSVDIPLSNFAAMRSNAAFQSTTGLPIAIAQPSADTNANPGPVTCNTDKFTGEPISLNLREADVRDFFRLIHEISGLNVVLDPDVRGSLTLVLDEVPWDQALGIVLRNSRLDCELQGNVLRIASTDTLRREADTRRAQIEAQQQAVDKITVNRYLSYANANEAKATIAQFLSPRGSAVVDRRTNSLVITDIPNVIPNIDALIKELDRKTPEVEIEARVVSTGRNFARDIGTQFGFGWGNGTPTTAIGGDSSGASVSPLKDPQVLNPHYILNGTGIPLFSNHPAAGGGIDGLQFSNATNNYRVDFILSLAETRGLAKILSRPRIVTQNNSVAQIRQGIQIPVVTSAQLGGPPTTTYINAFLRLSVTPQITAEGTIFMNIDVENTTPNFANAIGGNPELDTQQATTQVLVTNGGTVMIGGVVQTTSSVSVDQVPLLGDIPVLGNMFKHKAISNKTNELIFFISPRIITT